MTAEVTVGLWDSCRSGGEGRDIEGRPSPLDRGYSRLHKQGHEFGPCLSFVEFLLTGCGDVSVWMNERVEF